ncbi:MAG: sensor histidine kinase [Chitinophagaceae bacterium]
MSKPFSFLLLLLFPLLVNAQGTSMKDSLLKVLATSKEDTSKVYTLLRLARVVQNDSLPLAHQYCKDAYTLSEKIDYKNGRFLSILRQTALYRAAGDVNAVYENNKRFLALAEKYKDTVNLAIGYLNIGESYNDLGDNEKAIEYCLKGLAVVEKSGRDNLKQDSYDMLQRIYATRTEYAKAIEYGKRSVAIAREMKDERRIASALYNLAYNYNNNKEYDNAVNTAKEVIAVSQSIHDERIEAYGQSMLSDVNIRLKKSAEALPYSQKALELARRSGDRNMEATALGGVSLCYLLQKQYNEAESSALQALKINIENNDLDNQANIKKILADVYYAKNEPAKAYNYEREVEDFQNDYNKSVLSKQSSELEKKYETEKKEAQIQLQQSVIRQKNTLNFLLGGAALSAIIIGLMSYRNYRNKQKIQQQQIVELQTEKQLMATEAVLKGEERERTRLAKDLHDGLGGMLSGIKYSLNTMKGNLVMTPENSQAFERSMDMLDGSIKEMRRVAHNMMPEVLIKYGLDTALKDFCNDINQSGVLKVNYLSNGLKDASIDQTTAITIYRIVQELLSNTIRHASATSAIVQVDKAEEAITLTVEDDGKGFDALVLTQSKGIGWSNIQSRIDFLRGKLDVQSAPGKGTSVLIEFKV